MVPQEPSRLPVLDELLSLSFRHGSDTEALWKWGAIDLQFLFLLLRSDGLTRDRSSRARRGWRRQSTLDERPRP